MTNICVSEIVNGRQKLSNVLTEVGQPHISACPAGTPSPAIYIWMIKVHFF